MSKTPSSSLLGLLADRCPRALDYHEDNAPRDGSVFEAGIAAHAILDRFHRAQLGSDEPLIKSDAEDIAAATVTALSLKGRRYKGTTEAPLALERAREGAEVALSYLHRVGYQLPSPARPEVGLAVDRKWRPVPWDSPDAWYAGIVDCPYLTLDDYDRVVLVVRDYKSAWPAGQEDTGSLQMRGYVGLVLAHYADLFPGVEEEPEILRTEIVNLRMCKSFTAEWELGLLEEDELKAWRRDVDTLVAALPQRGEDGRRPASPGPRCMGCMYRLHCDAAPKDEPSTLAAQHAYHLAQAKALEDLLLKATAEAPVTIDGQALGWATKTSQVPTESAAQTLADLYAPDIAPGHLTLLKKVLGSTGVREAVKIVKGPGAKARRAELLKTILEPKVGRSWGWSKTTDDNTTKKD